MRMFFALAALPLALAAVPAVAQDAAPAPAAPVSPDNTAPDGGRKFGLEPYVGVLGGWEQFDSEPNRAGIPQGFRSNRLNGGLAEGVVGVNVPLGPVFVGAEGQVSKGFSGDIDWEYGGSGRFGLRAGDTGLIYGKVGYQWVNFSRFGVSNRDYHDMTYGGGFEVGPKFIGLGALSHAGVRLRGEVSTFGDAHSLRPMLGFVAHL